MAETMVPTVESALNPITALTFLKLGTSDLYLLAGEGHFLKVFDNRKRKLIHTERTFDSQAIHGIACESLPQDAGNSGALLIWGGRSICLISIEAHLDTAGEPCCKVFQYMPETLWDDWILGGCFRTLNLTDSRSGRKRIEAILVTAHNDLLRLKIVTKSAETSEDRCLYRIASGPSSILYSAHMIWADDGWRLLVAAGTVFGEVLFWSSAFDQSLSSEVYVHHRFTGHEGSVFGVRISDVAQAGAVQRILASCSDDRTIRIWNISDSTSSERLKSSVNRKLNESEAGFLEATNEADSTGCLAMIMGHTSRIWGLRFLAQSNDFWDLISYGEDSTAQVWRASPVPDKTRTMSTPQDRTYQLSHQTTYLYHSGKNLWAMAVFEKAREDCIVATGGADGGITTYKPNLHGVPARMSAWTSQYTMDEILKTMQAIYRELSPEYADKTSSTRNIFDSLKGSWKLFRNLDNVISTYPSGTLQGIANFSKRPPTDHVYDAEYLYSESGDFITQQGLRMRATRQYVYRYSKITDTISVWFVKPDDGSAVDYFFHKLDFRERNIGIDLDREIWSASGFHLCVDDNYNASYTFYMNDSSITKWHAVFNVNGPKKDYTANATYTRDQEAKLPEEPECMISPSMSGNRNAIGNQSAKGKPDNLKTYTWISENEVLTTTEHGNILVGTLAFNTERSSRDEIQNVIWDRIGHQTNLSSSCIATTIPSLGIALLTGAGGQINLYNHRSRKIGIVGKLPSKAGFLRAHRLSETWNSWLQLSHEGELVGVLATCLGISQATLFIGLPEIEADEHSTEKGAGFSAVQRFHLTLQPGFVVTSSCFLDSEKCIILGSRNGDIAIYDLAHTTPRLVVNATPNYFQDVHGEDAITLIQIMPHDISDPTGRPAIITAGRNGKWAIHHVFHRIENSSRYMSLETIHVGAPPFGPNIEGAYIDSMSKNLLLWGFRSKQFVVWNELQKMEVMSVDCGGAHRNWAYTPYQDSSGGGNFVYTKASVCHIHSQTGASHHVIQHGGHGREIKAMALPPPIKTSNDDEAKHTFLATGAEDTAIRIFDLNVGLKCLSIITKHTTGIQQLRWSRNGNLLFSAAGCEEFFVWRVRSAPLVALGVVCEAQCPVVTEEAALRITDFTIEEIHSRNHRHDENVSAYEPDFLLSIVYSDSSVRIFRYHNHPFSSLGKHNNTFKLLSEGLYTTYCLTQAAHLHVSGNLLSGLCTASTDGHLAFWSLPNSLLSAPNDTNISTIPSSPATTNPTPPPLNWTTRTPIHQNSIKALDCATISPSNHLIATGGDDGALAFTRVRIRKASQDVVFDTSASILIPSAHASAVTGVVFLGEFESRSDSGNGSESELNELDGIDAENNDNTTRSIAFASVSNDQRLKIWHLTINIDRTTNTTASPTSSSPTTTSSPSGPIESALQIKKVANVHTSVADANAIGFCPLGDGGAGKGKGRGCVVLAGIGVERWWV